MTCHYKVYSSGWLRLLRINNLLSNDNAVSKCRAECIAHRFEALQKRHKLAAVLPGQRPERFERLEVNSRRYRINSSAYKGWWWDPNKCPTSWQFVGWCRARTQLWNLARARRRCNRTWCWVQAATCPLQCSSSHLSLARALNARTWTVDG